MREFQPIAIDPEVMGGKPCIRGMRSTVGVLVETLASGRTIEQLLAFADALAQGREIRFAS